MKKLVALITVLIPAFILSGCVARTYQMSRDRVDQDLGGNRGFVNGSVPQIEETDRKETRAIRVFELELGKWGKSAKKKAKKAAEGVSDAEISSPAPIESAPIETAAQEGYQEYKVEKTDTLQKISQKFYGTTKKWKKIFDYNSDTLKTPDKLYPGKIIKIPTLPDMKTPESSEAVPANLK